MAVVPFIVFRCCVAHYWRALLVCSLRVIVAPCGVVFCVVLFYREVVWFLYCVVACVVSCRVVLSCCVSVRWVVRWCVASGIVIRCCALLLVGFSRFIACCVAYRCLVVCCGLVFLVVGLVVVCYVSALCGVVFLFCWLRSIVVPCSSVGLCRVVWFAVALPWFCGGVLVAVLCCAVLCCCEPCYVVLGYVLCLGTRFVALSCGVV